MSAFDILANDRVTVIKQGQSPLGPFKAVVNSGKITIFDERADVAEGDFVRRTLPSGREEDYKVLESNFQAGLAPIPAHFTLTVRKLSLPDPPPSHQNITIHGAQAVQIGNANTQILVGTLQALIQQIDEADAPASEKREAKGRLRAFLEHPVVSSVVGAAAGSILSGLG